MHLCMKRSSPQASMPVSFSFPFQFKAPTQSSMFERKVLNPSSAAGAKMVGYVDAGGYQHAESKSVKGDKFLGLPCDQDNEDDMTEDRVDAWIAQIKSEGMPL